MNQIAISPSETKQMYAQAVNVLFGGTIAVTADEITNEVIVLTDTMITEIANCSRNITKIGFEIIYKVTVGRVIDAGVNAFSNNLLSEILINEATDDIQEEIKTTLENWVYALMGNRRFLMCINAAKLRYRSPLVIALMGL